MAETDISQTAIPQRIYFKNLDILRFVAAYIIVVLHCFAGWKVHFGGAPLNSFFSDSMNSKIEMIMNNLSIGVDLFFIISGFLLTYLLLAEHEKTGKVEVLKFYIRRAFRIWPLYFFLILLAPLLTYFFDEQSPGYLYHFFFAGNFDMIQQGSKSVATDHLWSICVEEHFYLICPLMIAFIPVKKLPQVLSVIILGAILFRGFIEMYSPNYGAHIYLSTFSRIDVLAFGSLFGYLVYHKKIEFNHPLWLRLMIYSVFLFVFFNAGYVECGTFFSATIKKYFFVLVAAYWMGNFMFNPNAIFAAKGKNIFHQLGKVSYGIYMFNSIVIFLLVNLFSTYNFHNYFIFLVLVHICLFATTQLSYRFIELPFLALKEKYAVVKSGDMIKNEEPVENDLLEEKRWHEKAINSFMRVFVKNTK
jgi:peptidoglycan/LPS O-acetylase OafA/YrhL